VGVVAVSKGLAGAAVVDESDEEREHRRRRIRLWPHPSSAKPIDSFFFVASVFWRCSSPFDFSFASFGVFVGNRETDTEFHRFLII
jgi:hypothetical protein